MITPADEVIIETLRLLLINWRALPNVSPRTIKKITDLIVELKTKKGKTK